MTVNAAEYPHTTAAYMISPPLTLLENLPFSCLSFGKIIPHSNVREQGHSRTMASLSDPFGRFRPLDMVTPVNCALIRTLFALKMRENIKITKINNYFLSSAGLDALAERMFSIQLSLSVSLDEPSKKTLHTHTTHMPHIRSWFTHTFHRVTIITVTGNCQG